MIYSPTATQVIKAVKKLSASRWPFDYHEIFGEVELDPFIQIDYSSHLWQWATSVAASGKWSEPGDFVPPDGPIHERTDRELLPLIRKCRRERKNARQIMAELHIGSNRFYRLLRQILDEEQAA